MGPTAKSAFTSKKRRAGIEFPTKLNYAQHTRHTPPNQVRKKYGADYQGHADGRGFEDAQGPAGRCGGTPLRHAHERGSERSKLPRRRFLASAHGKAGD